MLYPLFAQTAGIIFWVFLTWQSVEFITSTFPQINIWLLWTAFLLANLPGMYLFFNGFWHYMVWVSALNLVVRELEDRGTCSDNHACAIRITCRPIDYSLILTFMFGMIFIPLGLAMVPIALTAYHPEWYWACIITALIVLSLGSIVVCMALILFVMVFQVFAFTPGSAGASLFRSMDLVVQNIGKTIVILLVSVGVTQFIIPSIIVWGFNTSQVTEILANILAVAGQPVMKHLHMELISLKQNYPEMTWIINYILTNSAKIGIEFTGTLIYTYVSALLLPLGTCWFALLYGDLKTSLELKEIPTEPPKKLAHLS